MACNLHHRLLDLSSAKSDTLFAAQDWDLDQSEASSEKCCITETRNMAEATYEADINLTQAIIKRASELLIQLGLWGLGTITDGNDATGTIKCPMMHKRSGLVSKL